MRTSWASLVEMRVKYIPFWSVGHGVYAGGGAGLQCG